VEQIVNEKESVMIAARITTAIALVATLATPLAVSANPSTSIEDIRYDRSERSNPN